MLWSEGCSFPQAGAPCVSPTPSPPPRSIWTAPACRLPGTRWFRFSDLLAGRRLSRQGLLPAEGGEGVGIPNPSPFPGSFEPFRLAGRGLPSGRQAGTMRQRRAGPGGSVADLSNPGKGAPAGECPLAAVLVLIWGLVENWGRREAKLWFPASAPPQSATPFKPVLRVALFFDFTFWRYWAHDSAPGRGEGEGEARPSGFTPRVGGRRSRRRGRENAVMQEKSRPRPALLLLTWFRTESVGSWGVFFCLRLRFASSRSANLTTI